MSVLAHLKYDVMSKENPDVIAIPEDASVLIDDWDWENSASCDKIAVSYQGEVYSVFKGHLTPFNKFG